MIVASTTGQLPRRPSQSKNIKLVIDTSLDIRGEGTKGGSGRVRGPTSIEKVNVGAGRTLCTNRVSRGGHKLARSVKKTKKLEH